jgi:site-specific DNA recombinase
MLINPKYVGTWVYGTTTTVYNSVGKSKRVPARDDQRVTQISRPALRIIDQPIWEAAQKKTAELREIYGMREGGRKRGPVEHYTKLYAKNLLYGLVRCAACGGKFVFRGNGRRRSLGCDNHRGGVCSVSAHIPLVEAEGQRYEVLRETFLECPDWLKIARRQMEETLRQKLSEIPNVLQQAQSQLRDVERRIAHIADALAQGIRGESVQEKLKSLEAEKSRLLERIAEIQQLPATQNPMPSDEWVTEQLRNLSELIVGHEPGAICMCRAILGDIIAEEVKLPGKKRGYIRVRIQPQSREILKAVVRNAISASAFALLVTEIPTGNGEQILLDFGRPTRMDKWAPQIAQWRQLNMPWHEIARRTGLKIANAYIAWKRFVEGGGEAA